MCERMAGGQRLLTAAIGQRHDVDAAGRNDVLRQIIHMAVTHEIDTPASFCSGKRTHRCQMAPADCNFSTSVALKPHAFRLASLSAGRGPPWICGSVRLKRGAGAG